MAEKSVFVPTGEVRLPRAGEWFWWPRANQFEKAYYDFHNYEYEIYEEIKIRVDEGSE